MTAVTPTKRRLQLALIVLLGILVLASVVALATGRTGTSTALSFVAYGIFSIFVATRVVPIRHRSRRDANDDAGHPLGRRF
ncbi:MAG TPA: hypothetical protein VGC04_01645 [Cellulomonas sp.]